MMSRTTNFVILNAMGARNDNFPRNVRALLAPYRPRVVAPLATRLEDHQIFRDDFNFFRLIAVPTGRSGGIYNTT